MLLATLLAATVFAVSPSPSPSCATPTQTGSYRFTAVNKDSTNAVLGMIVLENIDGCLEATLLTDNARASVVDHLTLSDDVLTGNVRVPNGTAKVTLRFTAAGLSGSIVDGRSEWKIAARRTSGSALDVAVR